MKKAIFTFFLLSFIFFSSVFAYNPTNKDAGILKMLAQKVEVLKKKNPKKLLKIQVKLPLILKTLKKRRQEDTQVYYILGELNELIEGICLENCDKKGTSLKETLDSVFNDNGDKEKEKEERIRAEAEKKKEEALQKKRDARNAKVKREAEQEKKKKEQEMKERLEKAKMLEAERKEHDRKLEEERKNNEVETRSDGTRVYRHSVCDHTYYRGPRGGCYYINGNGNKSYDGSKRCCRNR